ncbi:MAG: YggT family protein [Acidobacteria bacterium]|nr:YggT family protein [Acidobacteriota bacterium]MCH8985109.1 YggT family protein [Acidobacteriota bacterium]
MSALATLLGYVIWVIIAWIVLGYIVVLGRVPGGHPVRKAYDALEKVIQPVLRPIRNVLPPVRIGGAALDLAPMVLIFGVIILQGVLR